MKQRLVIKSIRGQKAIDGAGVQLVRVLSHSNVADFDPFLMLDSFDSTNPADYIKGFPFHPHRGIETVTYLIKGEIDHQDSLGNQGKIKSGDSQWMTAGSGILHQEMPQESDHMLGFQLWLNLPQKDKMTPPQYFDIPSAHIPEVSCPTYNIRIVAGEFEQMSGATPPHLPATVLDIHLYKDQTIQIPTRPEDKVFVFLIQGKGYVEDQIFDEKTAILFGAGDFIALRAPKESDLRFIYFAAPPLQEPVAWGGPIVMNTNEELQLAFEELDKGTFIK